MGKNTILQHSLPTAPPPQTKWLLRISEVFAAEAPEIIDELGGHLLATPGAGYYLVEAPDFSQAMRADVSVFVRWSMPVDHSWPCCPRKMEGFIEKAAQAMARKFAPSAPQSVLVGALDGADRYYKTLGSNLRGRTLQLFPESEMMPAAEEQDPALPTLFCLVGKEGLFCGLVSPATAKGFYPGGTKFIRQSAPGTISRAGAKVAEALHHLLLYRDAPPEKSHWLELGACPGGMTSELLERGYRVTAVDRAPLDQRLNRAPGLEFFLKDVREFRPALGTRYPVLLCDMNGDPLDACKQVIRLSSALEPRGLVIFTLKSTGVESHRDILELYQSAKAMVESSGLKVLAKTHLTYNRQELTLFFEKL